MSEILVVDDERSMREFLEILLSKEGWQVRSADTKAAALDRVNEHVPDVVITDLKLKGQSGLDLLKDLKERFPEVEVVVITAFATNETAVQALQLGAYDYVTKPFQVDELRVVIQRALERQRLLRENLRMQVELSARYDFGNLVGRSAPIQEVYRLIELAAPTRSNVLVLGESGTGKELVARALHFRSPRRDAPFVPIDCASIPETLLEDELFGHVKGAFTGANADRKGLFELADGGTVFLDEVSEVPQPLQVKLLRVLQERTLRRLGDGKDRPVDVRVVAASNRNLDEEVVRGTFREDLFFRLNVIRIALPPLRDRREDIPDLVRHFVAKVAAVEGQPPPLVLDEAFTVLSDYNFPGNVRELENMVERAVALCGGRPIGPKLFVDYMQKKGPTLDAPVPEIPDEGIELEQVLNSVELRLLQEALRRTGGVKKDAASLLGISFRSIRYRLLKYNLD
jgi:two-component system response regulator PilR (NtrC family)